MNRLLPVVVLALAACADGTIDTATTDTGLSGEVPTEYAFRRGEGDSVAYNGQLFRQLLIDSMKAELADTAAELGVSRFPAAGEVASELSFYVDFEESFAAAEHRVSTTPAPLQTTYADMPSTANLADKIAGQDETGQYADWSTAFVGWQQDGVTTPLSLVRVWIDELDAAAVAWGAGDVPLDPAGEPVPAFYVSADGVDRQQLLEKFLRGAIGFSQGADDYLDDDTEGKGLLSDHTWTEGTAYTALEHQWDEGFGYFGASRTAATWTDDELAQGYKDIDGDAAIDLTTEKVFGHAGNAAKRDRDSVVATDFTAEAWEGFAAGRALLAATEGELTDEQFAELQGHRDQALEAWEKAIAASVVHYINATLQDMDAIGTDAYQFGAHAKHWSELKGFALAPQFNRRSPLVTGGDFARLHELIGQAPVLSDAGEEALDAYADDLRAARTLLGDAYGFDDANLGDDDGTNGW